MDKVIDVLRNAPGGRMTSHEIALALNVEPVLVYHVIVAMEHKGTVVSEWEVPDGQPLCMARRRVYRLPADQFAKR